jgi:transposase InsO family protein
VHEASSGVYGQLKVWDELNDEGTSVARCTVERLMRAYGIVGVGPVKAKKTTLPGFAPVAAPDLVRRDFSATRPDALWLADFTYIRTWEGWAYLSVVLDVYTRRIVGWQLASHMRQSLVTDAFEMALSSRQEHEDGLIAHSDNGSQYTSYEYTERLVRASIAPSRGRTGTALDNAMAESVISTLKRELVSRYRWPTRLDLELALVTYIGWYNARRRHRSLKRKSNGQTRRVPSWRLSNTLDASFCSEALEEALTRYDPPQIFNTDRGSEAEFNLSSQRPGCGGADRQAIGVDDGVDRQVADEVGQGLWRCGMMSSDRFGVRSPMD